MSLYPGKPTLVNPQDPPEKHKYVLDDAGLANSLAKAIEDAMDKVSQQVKGKSLPAVGKEDRRLLFVAISRGILQYLMDHQVTITTKADQAGHAHGVDLKVTMDGHTPH
jgi:hypothetical protein